MELVLATEIKGYINFSVKNVMTIIGIPIVSTISVQSLIKKNCIKFTHTMHVT